MDVITKNNSAPSRKRFRMICWNRDYFADSFLRFIVLQKSFFHVNQELIHRFRRFFKSFAVSIYVICLHRAHTVLADFARGHACVICG